MSLELNLRKQDRNLDKKHKRHNKIITMKKKRRDKSYEINETQNKEITLDFKQDIIFVTTDKFGGLMNANISGIPSFEYCLIKNNGIPDVMPQINISCERVMEGEYNLFIFNGYSYDLIFYVLNHSANNYILTTNQNLFSIQNDKYIKYSFHVYDANGRKIDIDTNITFIMSNCPLKNMPLS